VSKAAIRARNLAIARVLGTTPAKLGLFKRVVARIEKAARLPKSAGGARMVDLRESPGHTVVQKPPTLKANAAPFRPEIAQHVPPYGQIKQKTTGVMDFGGPRVIYQVSKSGDAPPKIQGAGSLLNDHVEFKTLRYMREFKLNEATLYLNQAPCSYTSARGADGCANILEKLMAPGEKITAYFPGKNGPDSYVFTRKP
jgi:hypothetical protein